MEAGADALMQDQNGKTTLHLGSANGDVACLTEIEKHMQEKLDLEIKNFERMMPLLLAVQKKYVEIIKVLVQYGVNIDAKVMKIYHNFKKQKFNSEMDV